MLIKAVQHEATNIFAQLIDNPDENTVLLTSFTGCAAFNIGKFEAESTWNLNYQFQLVWPKVNEKAMEWIPATI